MPPEKEEALFRNTSDKRFALQGVPLGSHDNKTKTKLCETSEKRHNITLPHQEGLEKWKKKHKNTIK